MATSRSDESPFLFEDLGIASPFERPVLEDPGSMARPQMPNIPVAEPIPQPTVFATTVKVYVRHGAGCPKRGDKYYRNCQCPKWIYSFHQGKDRRFSAKTRSWSSAEKVRRQIEDSFDPVKVELKELKEGQQAKRVRISDAINLYYSDVAARNLSLKTQRRCRMIFGKQLLGWSERVGIIYLDELTTARLTQWRALMWASIAPITSKAQQERVVNFFKFCVQQGWLQQNPAKLLSPIRVKQKPTDYFTPEEFERLVEAAHLCERGAKNKTRSATRLLTMLLLLRWSGLRIGDAAGLERSRLVGDAILVYQAKTGTPVFVPLPHELAEDLRKVPRGIAHNPRYFFWSGRGRADSAHSQWRRPFRRLFKMADIRNPDGSSKPCRVHMLRDTFAVGLLLAQVPIDQVSVLLGHASVKTTEKHYAPWVRARQEQAEKNVQRAHSVQGTTKSVKGIVNDDEETLFASSGGVNP